MTTPFAVPLALLFVIGLPPAVHPCSGATPVVMHPAPEDFENPAALRFADAVGHGDVTAALAAAKQAPNGVNTLGKEGGTGLWIAVNRGDKAMVRALLLAGANPNGAPDHAPLHSAVRDLDLDMIKLLLAGKADPNATMGGETPLDQAAFSGSVEAADLLLTAGADIDKANEVGATAILKAAGAEHWRLVMFMLDHGASVWRDAAGVTLGGYAAASRILPNNKDGIVLPQVIERLQKAGFPWPPPPAPQVRAMKAAGNWPPAGVKAR